MGEITFKNSFFFKFFGKMVVLSHPHPLRSVRLTLYSSLPATYAPLPPPTPPFCSIHVLYSCAHLTPTPATAIQAATAASMAEHPSHSTPQEGDGFTYEHFADRTVSKSKSLP